MEGLGVMRPKRTFALQRALMAFGSYFARIERPGRSSSQAIALVFQPAGVRMNCVEIMTRAEKGIPFTVPDFAYELKR
jgi:sugar-specific transcriptional regulator TrmB